jgi:hypothetical protein
MQDLKPQHAIEPDSSWHFVGAQCDCADPVDHGQLSRFISQRRRRRTRLPLRGWRREAPKTWALGCERVSMNSAYSGNPALRSAVSKSSRSEARETIKRGIIVAIDAPGSKDFTC